MSSRRAITAAACLPAAALSVWVFRGIVLFGELPFRRDMGRLFVPLKRVLSERLRAGQLPEWWPWDGLGMPLMSLPVVSAFHPTTLLYLALPFQPAFALQLLAAIPVGFAGAFWLSRALGQRRAFAALAATAYCGGGYFLGATEYTSISLAAAALPWLWWAALRCRSPGAAGPAGVALSAGSMLLAGDPHLATMGVLAGAALWIRRTRARRNLAAAGRYAAGVLMSGLVAAVQLVPTAFLYAQSPRASGAGLQAAGVWRLHLEELWELAAAGASPATDVMFQSTYAGALVLALALVGGVLRRGRHAALLAIAAVALLLASGDQTPLWGAFRAVVPLWKSFQFPVKAIGPAALALAILAACTAQRALVDRRVRAAAVALLLVASAGALLSRAWTSGATALAAAGVLAACRTSALRGRAAALLLALAALDLAIAHGGEVPTLDPGQWDQAPLADAMKAAGAGSEAGYYLHLWEPPSQGPVLSQQAALLPSLTPAVGALHGLPAANGYLQGYSARFYDVASGQDAWTQRLAPVYGTVVYTAVASVLRPDQLQRALFIDPALQLALLRYRHSLPRAYVAYSARELPYEDAVAYLAGPGFKPGAEIVLEPGAGAPPQQSLRAPTAATAVRRDGDAVEVDVTAAAPGYLVLNEAYFEGLRATDNGVPAPVLPANHAVRAVAVGSGAHTVRFEFSTPGLGFGAATSAATLLALAGWALSKRRLGLTRRDRPARRTRASPAGSGTTGT